jgi:hypothetical protein
MLEKFTAWRRPAIFREATGAHQHGRLEAELPLFLSDSAAGEEGIAVPFLLTGPQDVVTLAPGLVVGRQPVPGTRNAETTRVAHIDLAEADLPWRYTPRGNDPRGVAPWLVLIVGETGSEVSLTDQGQVRLSGAVFGQHDLSKSSAWAHVHDQPGRSVSRILCPRSLGPGKSWTAVLVPAWTMAGVDPVPAWGPGTSVLTLPCFDSWQFATSAEADDFRSIAARLEPVSNTERDALRDKSFARAKVQVALPSPGTPLPADEVPVVQLDGGGALTLPGSPVTPPTPPPVSQRLQRLTSVPDHAGRWVLSLPRYDEPWSDPGQPVPGAGWRQQLHLDPRHRGAAALGAWAATAWQDRIAQGATAQAGALAQVAQRIRELTWGLEAARSQWRRHVPAPGAASLTTLAPMLARLPTPEGESVSHVLAGRTPWLVPALFSSAARRMLRPRTALRRAAGREAPSHTELVEVAAQRCAPDPVPLPEQQDIPGLVADPDRVRRAGTNFREVAFGVIDEFNQHAPDPGLDAGALLEEPDPDGVIDVIGEWPDPKTPCSPVDPEAVGISISEAVDPTGPRPVVVDHVTGGITGLRPPELAPPDLALELNIPLWSFLRDASPDWLLPGAAALPEDRVVALQTNPEFVDAFLIGANQRALGELRWRNIPVVSGWTPLRRFWQRITDNATAAATDVRPVLDVQTTPAGRTWSDASVLGDAAHQPTGPASLLVVLLRTDLFRRYPATQVYLTPNPGAPGTWGDPPNVDLPGVQRIHPNLTGSVDPRTVFFGFPLTTDAAKGQWLVLEEPPPGLRFHTPDGAAGGLTDGAKYAAATLDRPIRAFFGRLLT